MTLDAESVTALAENGSGANHGLWNVNNAQATVRGGSLTGRGGEQAYGIYNWTSSTTLEAKASPRLGEDGKRCQLRPVQLRRCGGDAARRLLHRTRREQCLGHLHTDSNTTLEAEGVTALGENASIDTYGLYNDDGGAAATVRGGSFTGRGGTCAKGIYNAGIGTTLKAESVTALGENGSDGQLWPAQQDDGAATTLRGGSFTGRGGIDAYGI